MSNKINPFVPKLAFGGAVTGGGGGGVQKSGVNTSANISHNSSSEEREEEHMDDDGSRRRRQQQGTGSILQQQQQRPSSARPGATGSLTAGGGGGGANGLGLGIPPRSHPSSQTTTPPLGFGGGRRTPPVSMTHRSNIPDHHHQQHYQTRSTSNTGSSIAGGGGPGGGGGHLFFQPNNPSRTSRTLDAIEASLAMASSNLYPHHQEYTHHHHNNYGGGGGGGGGNSLHNVSGTTTTTSGLGGPTNSPYGGHGIHQSSATAAVVQNTSALLTETQRQLERAVRDKHELQRANINLQARLNDALAEADSTAGLLGQREDEIQDLVRELEAVQMQQEQPEFAQQQKGGPRRSSRHSGSHDTSRTLTQADEEDQDDINQEGPRNSIAAGQLQALQTALDRTCQFLQECYEDTPPMGQHEEIILFLTDRVRDLLEKEEEVTTLNVSLEELKREFENLSVQWQDQQMQKQPSSTTKEKGGPSDQLQLLQKKFAELTLQRDSLLSSNKELDSANQKLVLEVQTAGASSTTAAAATMTSTEQQVSPTKPLSEQLNMRELYKTCHTMVEKLESFEKQVLSSSSSSSIPSPSSAQRKQPQSSDKDERGEDFLKKFDALLTSVGSKQAERETALLLVQQQQNTEGVKSASSSVAPPSSSAQPNEEATEQQHQQFKTTITKLQQDNASLQDQLDTLLQESSEALAAAKEEHGTEVASLKEKYQGELHSIKESHSKTKMEDDSKIEFYSMQMSEKQTQLNDLSTKFNESQTQVEKLESQLLEAEEKLKQKSNENENEDSVSKKKQKELEENLAAAKVTVAQLETKVADLTSSIDKLTTEKQNAEKEIANKLSLEHEKLQISEHHYNELVLENEKLNQIIQEAKSENEKDHQVVLQPLLHYQTECEKLQAENSSLYEKLLAMHGGGNGDGVSNGIIQNSENVDGEKSNASALHLVYQDVISKYQDQCEALTNEALVLYEKLLAKEEGGEAVTAGGGGAPPTPPPPTAPIATTTTTSSSSSSSPSSTTAGASFTVQCNKCKAKRQTYNDIRVRPGWVIVECLRCYESHTQWTLVSVVEQPVAATTAASSPLASSSPLSTAQQGAPVAVVVESKGPPSLRFRAYLQATKKKFDAWLSTPNTMLAPTMDAENLDRIQRAVRRQGRGGASPSKAEASSSTTSSSACATSGDASMAGLKIPLEMFLQVLSFVPPGDGVSGEGRRSGSLGSSGGGGGGGGTLTTLKHIALCNCFTLVLIRENPAVLHPEKYCAAPLSAAQEEEGEVVPAAWGTPVTSAASPLMPMVVEEAPVVVEIKPQQQQQQQENSSSDSDW